MGPTFWETDPNDSGTFRQMPGGNTCSGLSDARRVITWKENRRNLIAWGRLVQDASIDQFPLVFLGCHVFLGSRPQNFHCHWREGNVPVTTWAFFRVSLGLPQTMHLGTLKHAHTHTISVVSVRRELSEALVRMGVPFWHRTDHVPQGQAVDLTILIRSADSFWEGLASTQPR